MLLKKQRRHEKTNRKNGKTNRKTKRAMLLKTHDGQKNEPETDPKRTGDCLAYLEPEFRLARPRLGRFLEGK